MSDFSQTPPTATSVLPSDGAVPPAPTTPPSAEAIRAANEFIFGTAQQTPDTAAPAAPAQPAYPSAQYQQQPYQQQPYQQQPYQQQPYQQQPYQQQPYQQQPYQQQAGSAWWQQPATTQPPPSAASQPWFDPTAVRDYGLDAETAAKYAAALPVVEQVVNAKLRAAEQAFRERTAALEQGFGQSLQNVAAQNEAVFANLVQSAIPDLAQKKNDPAWGQYLTTRVPGTGSTVAQLLQHAYNNQDVESLVELVRGFKPTGAPAAPMGGSTVSPYANPTVHTGNAPAGQMLPVSKHTQAAAAFVKGQINEATWKAIDAQYAEARAKGLVDMNR